MRNLTTRKPDRLAEEGSGEETRLTVSLDRAGMKKFVVCDAELECSPEKWAILGVGAGGQ
jgi:hypothetical protein